MMQFRTPCLSAHLDSFCRKLDELCGLEFVYAEQPSEMRQRVGCRNDAAYRNGPITPENTERAKSVEFLYDMLREIDLFEARAKKGLTTVYASERWFKPIGIVRLFGLFGCSIPGWCRMLVPRYWRMARRFVKLMDDPNFHVFAIGVHAVRDFVRMYWLFHGDWKALFREPKVGIERKLGGSVEGFPRMRLWAYFVEGMRSGLNQSNNRTIEQSEQSNNRTIEQSEQSNNRTIEQSEQSNNRTIEQSEQSNNRTIEQSEQSNNQTILKILWTGRMIDWKRVDTLIRAFRRVAKGRPAALLLVGEGPERRRLERLAGEDRVIADALEWQEGKVVFHDYVTNDVVRELMRRADVFVMPSGGEEGWGAVVSEALSEGCPVISTHEAGSSATLLPEECLFHSGDAAELADRLLRFKGGPVGYDAAEWSGEAAAERLFGLTKKGLTENVKGD